MHKVVDNRCIVLTGFANFQNSLEINRLLHLVVVALVGTQYIGEAL